MSKKFRYNYVLISEWYIVDDSPTNIDLLITPFSWNYEKIKEYVKNQYGITAKFEIVTNNPTIAKDKE